METKKLLKQIAVRGTFLGLFVLAAVHEKHNAQHDLNNYNDDQQSIGILAQQQVDGTNPENYQALVDGLEQDAAYTIDSYSGDIFLRDAAAIITMGAALLTAVPVERLITVIAQGSVSKPAATPTELPQPPASVSE